MLLIVTSFDWQAEVWVNNMSKAADDETTDMDIGVRHPRLA